jgi:hypothetical protein
MREVNEAHEARKAGENPIPVLDPTGSYQTKKMIQRDEVIKHNLGQIRDCLMVQATSGSYPERGHLLKQLILSNAIADARICAMPRSNLSRDDILALKAGVLGCTWDQLRDSTPAEKPIVWEPEPVNDTRLFLTFGGEIREAMEADFAALKLKYEGK